ncbi:MAG: phage tail tape measure protein, partial [Lentisphaeria bacterium]|nr:phage tail tape measure protein [Lentisphaeria bacterium]
MGITASAIRAGRAFVELSLEKTKFVRDLRKLQNSLRSTGNYLKGLGNDMMLLGGTGVLPFAGALKMFSDFDDKMRTLKAVTGATDAQMASLRAQTKELGATTAFTASQVGDASVTLARMGLGVNGVKNGLKPMLNLTRATGTETHRVGEAAQFAASTLGQYDLEASKFADICDVMAYAANHSAMDIFDMGEAIKIAGPSAKTVNEDIRDTAASLMLLANAG